MMTCLSSSSSSSSYMLQTKLMHQGLTRVLLLLAAAAAAAAAAAPPVLPLVTRALSGSTVLCSSSTMRACWLPASCLPYLWKICSRQHQVLSPLQWRCCWMTSFTPLMLLLLLLPPLMMMMSCQLSEDGGAQAQLACWMMTMDRLLCLSWGSQVTMSMTS
jgi:hypothetical protein